MSAYGEFVPGRELFRRPFGALYAARKQGDKTDRYVIKTRTEDLIALADPEMGDPRAQIVEFNASVELQTRLGRLPNSCWAPIIAAGDTGSEAYAVLELYPRTARLMIDGRTKLDAAGLYSVARGVLTGLMQLQEHAGRAFGTMKASNVLVAGGASPSKWKVRLTDPPGEVDADAPEDLNALGAILFSLVTHREWNPQLHPLRKTGEWARLGSSADGWLLLINQMLDPGLAETLGPDDFLEQVEKLGSVGGGVPVAALGIGGVVAVAAIGAGVYFFLQGGGTAPGPNGPDTPELEGVQRFTSAEIEAWGRAHDLWLNPIRQAFNRERSLRDALGPEFRSLIGSPDAVRPVELVSETGPYTGAERQTEAARAIAAYFDPLMPEAPTAFAVEDPEGLPARLAGAVAWTRALRDELSSAHGVDQLKDVVGRLRDERVGWTRWAGTFDEFIGETDATLAGIGATANGEDGGDGLTTAQAVAFLNNLVSSPGIGEQWAAYLDGWAPIDGAATRFETFDDPILRGFRRAAAAAVDATQDYARLPEVLSSYAELAGVIETRLDEFGTKGIDPALFAAESSLHAGFAPGTPPTREQLLAWVSNAGEFAADWLDPSTDPRLRLDDLVRTVDASVGRTGDEIAALPDLGPDALGDYQGRVAAYRDEVDAQRRALASSLSLDWTTTNQSRIDASSTSIRRELERISQSLPLLAEEATVASNQSEADQLEALRAMTLDTGVTELDDDWAGYVGARVSTYRPGERAELLVMSEELQGQRRAITDLVRRLGAERPVYEDQPRAWDQGVVNAAYGAYRAGVLAEAIGELEFADGRLRLAGGPADEDAIASLTATQEARLAEWNRAVAEAARGYAAIERAIAGLDASALALPVPALAEDVAAVGSAFASIRAQRSQVVDATEATDRAALERIARTPRVSRADGQGASSPLLARYVAWQRLGEDGFGWPSGPSELEREVVLQAELRVQLEAVGATSMIGRLAEEGQRRWARAWSSSDVGGLDAVFGEMGVFGLDVGTVGALPAPVSAELDPGDRYNLATALARRDLAGLDLDDPAAQRRVLDTFSAIRSEFGAGLEGGGAAMVAELGSALDEALAELDGGADAGPGWDQTMVSPASSGLGWTFDEAASSQDLLVFRHAGALSTIGRGDPGSLAMTFRLIEPPGADPFYISTSEVSVGVLAEVVAQKGGIGWVEPMWRGYREPFDQLAMDQIALGGYEVDATGRVVLVDDWYLDHQAFQSESPYPPELRDSGDPRQIDRRFAPSGQMPAHGLSVAGAFGLASALGCWIPTETEWRAAWTQGARSPDQPNVADSTLAALYSHNARLADNPGLTWRTANRDALRGVSRVIDGSADTPSVDLMAGGVDDGHAWFRPVGSGSDGLIRDLHGNVFEPVLAGDGDEILRSERPADVSVEGIAGAVAEQRASIRLMGGSAMSDAAVAPDQARGFESRFLSTRRTGRGWLNGELDVGVRLVFPGGRGSRVRSVVERVLTESLYVF